MPDVPSTTGIPEGTKDTKPRIPRPMLLGALTALALMGVLAVAISWVARIKVEWGLFLGPLHVVVLHFPLVLLLLVAVLEVAWWRHGGEELRRIILWLMQLSAASTLLTVGLGIFLSRQGGYDAQLVQAHRNYGLGVMWVSVVALALLTWANHLENLRLRYGFRAVLAGILVLLVMVGHSGGTLTHGSQFFLKNAPPFLQSWLGETPVVPSPDEKSRFTRDIWPILEARCLKCHGPEKQKGDLRVDNRESLLAGGDSEKPALVPGDPASSLLIQRILLAENHDDVMPTKGKGRVTKEEAMKLIEWIQGGAQFTKAPTKEKE